MAARVHKQKRSIGRLVQLRLLGLGLSAAVALSALYCTPTYANFGDVYGFGARAASMAGAHTALANDLSALHYNISGMTFGKPGFGLGFHVGLDDVSVRLKARPNGYDLPDRGVDSPRIPTAYRLRQRGDTTDLPNLYQVLIGGTWSLGIHNFRVGFAALLPANGLGAQGARFPDEREQYHSNRLDFDLIGRRSNQFSLLTGAAYRLYDWLSVGAGLSIMPSAITRGSAYLPDASDQANLDLSLSNQQGARVGFNAGVTVQPIKPLRLGISWRGENYFAIDVVNEVQINGFQNDAKNFPVVQRSAVVANYTPDTLSVGAAWQHGTLTLSGDVVYAYWRDFRDAQGLQPRAFHNTLSVRLGGEFLANSGTRFRAGVSWEPTPVPAQTGRTNYVDNDRLRASVGAGHPLHVLNQDFELSWVIGIQHLLPRDTNKTQLDSYPPCGPGVTQLCDEIADSTVDPTTGQPDPAYAGLQSGNPGFPGWQSFGDLLSVGVDLAWRF